MITMVVCKFNLAPSKTNFTGFRKLVVVERRSDDQVS